MGVMECSRRHCDNILCNTYIDDIGFVCRECQAEFKKYLLHEGIAANTEKEIEKALSDFMETTKDDYSEAKNEEMDVDDFFKQNKS